MLASYQNKIHALQKQIEEKAKELGKISSIIEEFVKQREKLTLDIAQARDRVHSKESEYKELQKKIRTETRNAEMVVLAKNKTSEILSTEIKSLIGDRIVLEKEIKILVDKRDEEKKILARIEEKKKELLSLQDEHKKTQELVKAEKESLAKAYKELEKITKKAEETSNMVRERIAGCNERVKILQFYTRRLKKAYMEKGRPFPKDLEEIGRFEILPSNNLIYKLNARR